MDHALNYKDIGCSQKKQAQKLSDNSSTLILLLFSKYRSTVITWALVHFSGVFYGNVLCSDR